MTERSAYVTHAEKFGVECVYETAAEDLGATDLALLAQRLVKLDRERYEAERTTRGRRAPVWRLPQADRNKLIPRLEESGWPVARIAQTLDISLRTVQQALQAASDGAKKRENDPTQHWGTPMARGA